MADVKVRIIAVDEASGPIKKAGDEVEKTGKKAKEAGGAFEGLGKTMLSVAGGLGLQTGLAAVVGGLKNAIVGSFELADALEQSKIAFTTMLGSGEAAGKMLNDLKSFADKTPFEFQDIQAAAKRLMAMGTAADDVIPTLRAVGDAAAGLGGGKATIDGITLALGQMGAKGKISTQELNQLTERGIPAMRYLAEAAGVSTGEMAKLVEKGLVPANTGVKVLLESMQKDFGGLMAKQAETASGKLSTMKDSVAGLGTEIGKSLVPAVKEGATVISLLTAEATKFLQAHNNERDIILQLDDALRKSLITREEFLDVERSTIIEVAQGASLFKDQAEALDLLAISARRAAQRFAESRDEEVRYTAGMANTRTALDLNAKAIDHVKEAAKELAEVMKEQAFLIGIVGGATTEYEKDQKTNTKTITETEEAIAKLTKNYRGQHAALLAGKGSIVDNTLAIEKANIAAERGEIAFGKLNERFANQSGIDAFNEGMANVDEAMRKLNEENAKGEMSADKFAEATKKLGERQNDVRERFDKSKMSTQEYNLSVRDHNVDLAEAATKMGELTAEHGKGFTAAELAAQATGAYNTKLAEMQTKLELAKQRDIELQTQVATRIKEGILLEEIALAAKDGFTKGEIELVDAAAKALGIADSAAVQGAITTGIAATTLADLRKTYQKDFDEGNAEGVRLFGVGVDQVGSDIQNKLRPSFDRAQDSIKDTKKEMRELRDEYNGIQSKDVTIKITTIRETINRAAFAQIATNVASAKEIAAGERAMGGPVMGGAGAYLVGERGPELFNPSGTGGTITPNHALGRSGLAIGTLNVYGVQSTSELFNQLSREARARGLQFAVN